MAVVLGRAILVNELKKWWDLLEAGEEENDLLLQKVADRHVNMTIWAQKQKTRS